MYFNAAQKQRRQPGIDRNNNLVGIKSVAGKFNAGARFDDYPLNGGIFFEAGSELDRSFQKAGEQAGGLNRPAANRLCDVHLLAIVAPRERLFAGTLSMSDLPASRKVQAAVDSLSRNEILKLLYARIGLWQRPNRGSLKDQPTGSATGAFTDAARFKNTG